MYIQSDYFCDSGITIENTVVAVAGGYKIEEVALRLPGNKAVLYKVRILGTQDTFLDDNRSHLYQCYIQGSINFIFGKSGSLYRECNLHSVADKYGAIAAHYRNSEEEETGFFFPSCSITASGGIYLGRAWGNYSRMVYSYCDIDNIIDPYGWSEWNHGGKVPEVLHQNSEIHGRDNLWRVEVLKDGGKDQYTEAEIDLIREECLSYGIVFLFP